MLAMTDVPPELENLYLQTKKLSSEIYSEVSAISPGQPVTITAGTDIIKRLTTDYLYVQNGFIKVFKNDKILRFYSDSDLVVIDHKPLLKDCIFLSEFASEVISFNKPKFLQAISSKRTLVEKWTTLKELESIMMLKLCCVFMKEEITPNLGIQNFQINDVIIKAGDPSNEIYYMINGIASVKSNDVELATINQGEIFGEMGYLTQTTRVATVIAKTPCMVQVIKKEEFPKLIQSKPRMAEELLQTMAKRIVALNKKVAP